MTITVQLTIIFLGILLMIAVINAAVHKNITEAHALLWIIPCFFIIVGGIFPQLTYYLSNFFNTEYPPAIIFAFAIIILFLILFQCFKSLSVVSQKNKELASQITLQNEKIEKLTEQINMLEHIKDFD